MSKTYNTNKARTKRILNHKLIGEYNGYGDISQVNQTVREIESLEINGHRYGNKRKSQSSIKVIDRRIERRKANSNISSELF